MFLGYGCSFFLNDFSLCFMLTILILVDTKEIWIFFQAVLRLVPLIFFFFELMFLFESSNFFFAITTNQTLETFILLIHMCLYKFIYSQLHIWSSPPQYSHNKLDPLKLPSFEKTQSSFWLWYILILLYFSFFVF